MKQVFNTIHSTVVEKVFAKGWLVSCLEELGQWKEEGLQRELLLEWLDVVDTQVFQSALFELISDSFQSFSDSVETMLKEPGQLVMAEGPEPVVHVVKLSTLLFRKNNEGLFAQQLAQDMQMYMSFDQVCGCEDFLAQLAKFVYFGALYECTLKDLL